MTRAFVLHARPWRETSLLVDWFTEDHGRLTTRQRGARQTGRKSSGRPLPFQCLQMLLVGRGEIKTATQVDLVEPPRWLSGQALAVGFYLNELLIRALQRDEPMPMLFAHYARALGQLSDVPLDMGLLIRRFERELLEELGFGIDWHCTVDQPAPIDETGRYWIDPQVGILCRPGSGQCIPISGQVIQAIAADQPLSVPAERRAARDLMQQLLEPHVGTAPFHSRALWRSTPIPAQP